MKQKVFLPLLLFLLFLFRFPLPASANSAESPTFTVLVENPPDDLALTVLVSGTEEGDIIDELFPHRLAWEGYYRFWAGDWEEGAQASLLVETGGERFTIPLSSEDLSGYNTLFTLNLSDQTLSAGQPWWRQPLLVGLRFGLTVLLEGLVFFCFGYRKKQSWKVFFAVNCATQAFVNACILGFFPLSPLGYFTWLTVAAVYVPMELLVLAAERSCYRQYLPEHGEARAGRCAVVSNLFSWILGGALLNWLPI